MTIESGALEQSYLKKETSYLATPADALAAGDAIRHLELSITSKKNREDSPEKRGTPDVQQRLPRRQTTNWNLSAAMWEPSGTLGTESNLAKVIKGGLGAQHTIAAGLTTTVEAAPAPTATGCTLTSALNLAVGDLIVFTTGAGARKEITRVKTLAGAAITFDELSGVPDVPGAAVAGITFALASTLADSFAVYKYYNGGGFKQAAYGAVVDQLQITFDGTTEVRLAASGPAGDYADSTWGTVQAKPGSHTTIGSPASGLVGNFYVDEFAFLVISAQMTLNNAIELRNKELGTSKATGIAGRTAMRQVGLSITCYLEDTRLLNIANDAGLAGGTGVLRLVIGDTPGAMVGAVFPKVEFEIPEVGNEIGPKEITFEGFALATDGNDQVFLAEV